MDQDKTDPAQRTQTLLEAAKAATSSHDSYVACHVALRNLRAAIAREEVKQASLQDDAGRYAYWKSKATRYESERDTCYSDYQKEAARAQQAESTAAWHKAESERLSAELADARERLAYVEERVKWTRDYLGCREDQTYWIAAAAMRERAEKAEAERDLAKSQLALSLERLDRQSVLIRSATQASGCHIPEDVSDSIRSLRARAEKAEAEMARLGQQLARLCELQANPPVIVTQPFEGDPQTCAFGSNAFGGKPKRDDANEDPVDPTTGFTFATYRRLLEALGGKS